MVYLETIMLIALGFVLASLVALFLLRIVWHHGERVGRRRVQQQFPTTSEELRADRARLRAEKAMLTRKTELRIEDYKLQLLERDREIALGRSRMEAIGQELTQRDDQLGKLRGGRMPLEEELAERTTSLQTLQRSAREYLDQIQRLTREVEAAHATVKDRERLIADLRRTMRGQTDHTISEAPQVPDNLIAAETHLRERIAAIQAMTQELSVRRTEAQNLRGDSPGAAGPNGASRRELAGALDEADRTARHLVDEYARLDQKRDDGPARVLAPEAPPRFEGPSAERIVAEWARPAGGAVDEKARGLDIDEDVPEPSDSLAAGGLPDARPSLARLKVAKAKRRRPAKQEDDPSAPEDAVKATS